MKRITKLEKKFIKNMVRDILEIESYALLYTDDDFDNSYAAYCFAEKISEDINWYIDKMIDRNVNQNVIEQLKDLDFQLFERNVHLW